jgi:hypothetical protein
MTLNKSYVSEAQPRNVSFESNLTKSIDSIELNIENKRKTIVKWNYERAEVYIFKMSLLTANNFWQISTKMKED